MKKTLLTLLMTAASAVAQLPPGSASPHKRAAGAAASAAGQPAAEAGGRLDPAHVTELAWGFQEAVVDVLNTALGTTEKFGPEVKAGAKAVEVGASLIVIGRQGVGRGRSVPIGSVAER